MDGTRIFRHGEPKQEIFLTTQEYVIKRIELITSKIITWLGRE